MSGHVTVARPRPECLKSADSRRSDVRCDRGRNRGNATMSSVYLRYWGSHLKRPENSALFAGTVRRMRDAGFVPYLVCSRPPDDPQLEKGIIDAGAEIVYQQRPRQNFDVACIWRVYRLCRRIGCDIMHCDNMHTSPLIGAALAGVPVRIWSKRSMNSAYEMMREPTWRDRVVISVRTSCWLATRVLPVSEAVRDELAALGVASSKLTVLPNPVEVSPRNTKIRSQARAELGYRDDAIVFTTVGHAVPVKGWDVLLEAFRGTAGRCPEARLLYVGSTSDEHEQRHYQLLRKSIGEWGLGDRVRFLGHQPELQKALAASDVFVVSSRSEGYGNMLVEAMTFGLPCISTRVRCATDLIEDGVNGMLVERGDASQLCDAMTATASDHAFRAQLACAVQGQKKYAPTFSEHGRQLAKICRELLEQSRS